MDREPYNFPFKPYKVQTEFMTALYDVLESTNNLNGKFNKNCNYDHEEDNDQSGDHIAAHDYSDSNAIVGIFESPTGTGKTLSLICACLTWLKHYEQRYLLGQTDQVYQQTGQLTDQSELDRKKTDKSAGQLPEWVKTQHQINTYTQRVEHLNELRKELETFKKNYKKQNLDENSEQINHVRKKKKTSLIEKKNQVNKTDYDEFLLSYSEDNLNDCSSQKSNISNEVLKLLNDLNEKESTLNVRNNLNNKLQQVPEIFTTLPKIIFASRTHSQLSQFVHQLQMVHISNDLLFNNLNNDPLQEAVKNLQSDIDYNSNQPRFLPLASRKHYCINPKVNYLKDPVLINEKCLNLQKSTSDSKCPYLPNNQDSNNKQEEIAFNNFKNTILSEIIDIEDLVLSGKRNKVCPYYGTRNIIPYSEILSLPYPLLLQTSMRNALSLSLKNNIIIIDEAHNIIDAITSLGSSTISFVDLRRANRCFKLYGRKYINRLSGKNKVKFLQLLKLIQSLDDYIIKMTTKMGNNDNGNDNGNTYLELNVNEIFNSSSGMISIYELEEYLSNTKLIYKIEGFIEKMYNDDKFSKSIKEIFGKDEYKPVIVKTISILFSLMNPSNEGKAFIQTDENKNYLLKYILLDPSYNFKEIISQARAVVLAGGTMKPFEDYKELLFPFIKQEHLRLFSCGHVIPKENLSVFVIGTTNKNKKEIIEINYKTKFNDLILLTIIDTIQKIVSISPSGTVVFFSSYKYLNYCINIWRNEYSLIWNKLSTISKIFFEPTDSSQIDQVLNDYKEAIYSPLNSKLQTCSDIEKNSEINKITGNQQVGKKGKAVLLAVVGGKMSEGINFSDDLARAVLMIGLPYPDMKNIEIIERRKLISQRVSERLNSNKLIKDTRIKAKNNNLTLNNYIIKKSKEASTEYVINIMMRSVNQAIGRSIRHKNDYSSIFLLDNRYLNNNINIKLSEWVRNSLINCLDWEKEAAIFYKKMMS